MQQSNNSECTVEQLELVWSEALILNSHWLIDQDL